MAEIARHVDIVRVAKFEFNRLNNTLCTKYISLLFIDSIFMRIYFQDMFLQNKQEKVLIFNACRYILRNAIFLHVPFFQML